MKASELPFALGKPLEESGVVANGVSLFAPEIHLLVDVACPRPRQSILVMAVVGCLARLSTVAIPQSLHRYRVKEDTSASRQDGRYRILRPRRMLTLFGMMRFGPN